MTDIDRKPGSLEQVLAAEGSGVRLTKDQRKELLVEIERQLSRSESPGRILQRAEQALVDGRIDQARRLLDHLEAVAPRTAGLDVVRARIVDVERESKQRTNLQQAEEMLRRYIQQRKKPLAKLALETFVELAPHHPRLADYQTWVADLDRELELQQQVDVELEAGRAALRAGDPSRAERHLRTLEGLDSTTIAIEILAAEVAHAEQNRAESADIERLKEEFEGFLRDGRFEDADFRVERLARLDVPKITVDFFRKQLAEARENARESAESEALAGTFQRLLDNKDWQAARDVAHRFGERFPDRPDAARFFNLVIEKEAAERRKQSLEQGMEALETFLISGQRPEAEVALKLLRTLQLDGARLAEYEQRIAAL